MSCFASGCAIVVPVKRLWIVIHTARRSGPQSWGGCALNPIHLPRCGISEQTAVYEQDGLRAVGHHTAASRHHRVPVARRVAVRTSPTPPWALYQVHTYQNDKTWMAKTTSEFLHVRSLCCSCSLPVSSLTASSVSMPHHVLRPARVGLPTSVQTHKPPEHRAMNEAVARIIY